MVWQMRGGPACATLAKHSTAVASAIANLGERICRGVIGFESPFESFRPSGDKTRDIGELLTTAITRRVRSLRVAGRIIYLAFGGGSDQLCSKVRHTKTSPNPREFHQSSSICRSRRRVPSRVTPAGGEAIVHTRAIRIADAGEQVPNRERVFLAGVNE